MAKLGILLVLTSIFMGCATTRSSEPTQNLNSPPKSAEERHPRLPQSSTDPSNPVYQQFYNRPTTPGSSIPQLNGQGQWR